MARSAHRVLLVAVCLFHVNAQDATSSEVGNNSSSSTTAAAITSPLPVDENLCKRNQDCRDPSVMTCDASTERCKCNDVALVLTSSGRCLPGQKMGDSCLDSEQCKVNVVHSVCSDGVCGCSEGFFLLQKINASTCEPKSAMQPDGEFPGTPSPPNGPRHTVDHNMIIIMVVLAVMFVGICVALHLFSKARFRNHRTIFNSPHPRLMHIKLGKKKGRRRTSHSSLEVPGSRQLSICSQLSPVQSRRGSQVTSPNFNRNSQKGSAEKKENAKVHQLMQDSSSVSSADDLLKKDPPVKKVVNEVASSSSTVPNGPGSPNVIVSSGGKSYPANSSSARV